MLEIEMKVLTRLLATLDGMKIQYAIIIDGEKIGPLELKPAPAVKPLRAPKKPAKDYSAYRLQERLAALPVGQVLEIPLIQDGSGITGTMLQSNVCSRATALFGPKNYCTAVVLDRVQVLREA